MMHVSPSGLDLLAAYHRARDRVETNTIILNFIIDCARRIRAAKADFLYRDCNVDFSDVATEIERLRLLIRLAKEQRQ